MCSLARANDRDIQRAFDAVEPAPRKRVHTFIATSALHMEKKLRMSPEQVHEQAKLAVRYARNLIDDVEFSPEDGYRSDMDFLCRILETAIKEGASTINVPDTVGYAVPELYGHFMKTLRERIPNSDKAVWSVHCHNDLGMAVANSLAGVHIGGCRQVECTINGLGERAGNTSLEEVVMAVKTRRDFFDLEVGVDASQIVPTSRLVAGITGFVVQPNKAVVGANAFAHASGIHQDGVLKARDTYEIMRAEDVGWSANKIVLGKLSGRNAFKQRLQELGIELESEVEVNAAFQRFKDLADRKSDIFDEDIHALVSDQAVHHESDDHYQLVSMAQHSETGEHAAREHHDDGRRQGDDQRIGRQRAGGRGAEGDRGKGQIGRRTAAVLGQRDHDRHRVAGRGHGPACQVRPDRQRRRRRPRHRRRLGQGVSERAQQAAQPIGSGQPPDRYAVSAGGRRSRWPHFTASWI